MNKIRTIIDKEWAEVFKNKLVFFSVVFMPLLFVALPILTLWGMKAMGEDAGNLSSGSGDFFGDFCQGLSEFDCGQAYMLSLYALLFMILPLMIPVTIAAYSIVGEKTTRSLEPLLATPITTKELLTGKALAAVIPAIAATWLAFAIFLVSSWLMVSPEVFRVGIQPYWLTAVILVGPLLALFAVAIAMMISSRVTDPRTAEQLAGFVVLPVILILVGQSLGLFLINGELVLILAAVLIILDAILLALTVKIFQRETILTRWK
ncbi:MAG TPA: ABC transporter permease [Chloroflexi bacterium]|nr:ABC transporter permease [Chloroflexota bacterium]